MQRSCSISTRTYFFEDVNKTWRSERHQTMLDLEPSLVCSLLSCRCPEPRKAAWRGRWSYVLVAGWVVLLLRQQSSIVGSLDNFRGVSLICPAVEKASRGAHTLLHTGALPTTLTSVVLVGAAFPVSVGGSAWDDLFIVTRFAPSSPSLTDRTWPVWTLSTTFRSVSPRAQELITDRRLCFIKDANKTHGPFDCGSTAECSLQ